MADKNRVVLSGDNIGLSTSIGAITPYYGKDKRIDGALSLTIVSSLGSGSIVTFRQRLKAEFNTGGVAGTWDKVKQFTADDMGLVGTYHSHLTNLPAIYEFDLFIYGGEYLSGDGGITVQLIGA